MRACRTDQMTQGLTTVQPSSHSSFRPTHWGWLIWRCVRWLCLGCGRFWADESPHTAERTEALLLNAVLSDQEIEHVLALGMVEAPERSSGLSTLCPELCGVPHDIAFSDYHARPVGSEPPHLKSCANVSYMLLAARPLIESLMLAARPLIDTAAVALEWTSIPLGGSLPSP